MNITGADIALTDEQHDISEGLLNDVFIQFGTVNGSVVQAMWQEQQKRAPRWVILASGVPGEFDQYEATVEFDFDKGIFTFDFKIISDFNKEVLAVKRTQVTGFSTIEEIDGGPFSPAYTAIVRAIRGAVKDYA